MNDIKDVKPPLNLPDFWWILWLLLGLVAIAAAVYFFLKFKRPAKGPAPAPVPQLPAWEIAYQQLEALRRENLPDKGLFKEYFTRVADIARLYMENRFNIRAPHMSTEEFLYYLGNIPCSFDCKAGDKGGHLNEAQKAALKEFLNSCDMVKFAKYAPTLVEAQQNYDLAKRLVDDTRV